jgi:hypothetical protein
MTTRPYTIIKPERPWIDIETAREVAASMAANAAAGDTLGIARAWVFAVTGIRHHVVNSPRRLPCLVDVRCLMADLLIAAGWSYPQAGAAMKRDHSSVHHLVNDKPVAAWLKPYREIARWLGNTLGAAREAARVGLTPPPPEPPPVITVEATRAAATQWIDQWKAGKKPPANPAPDDGEPSMLPRYAVQPPSRAVMEDLRQAMLREAGVL